VNRMTLVRYATALSAAFLLAACGSDSNNQEAPPATPTPAASAEWARTSVFYEVFVRSFYDADGDGTGDLKGVTAKLDYLKGVGIDALWLMPIQPASSYHGYDVKDYGSVNPDYGTMDDFRALTRAAHDKGMRIVIDWVVNHTSNEHEWFQKSVAGDAEYADYYVWSDIKISDNWAQASNGRWYYCWYGNPQMPELNYRNVKVRERIKSLADFWIAQGVDGFRLDVAQNIGDGDDALTYDWWREFKDHVKTTKPDAYIVGEVNFDSLDAMTYHAPFYQGMDSTFNFPAYNYMLGMSTGLTRDILGALNTAHDEYALYNPDYMDAITLGNHDRARIASRLKFDPKLVRHAATLLMTLPGTPFLYYGEEIGMGGGHDQQADPNKREPFDWYRAGTGPGMTTMSKAIYGQVARNIHADDGISVEEEESNPDSTLAFYKKLIVLRKAHPMLFHGQYIRAGTPADTYGYKVSLAGADYALYVIHNQDVTTAKTLTLTVDGVTELLSGAQYKRGDTVSLSEFGSVILKVPGGVRPIAPMPVLNVANPKYRMHFLVNVPPQTPGDAPLFMPNSDDGWDPVEIKACAPCTLSKVGERQYALTLERERGTILEYKYFRDRGWDTAETDAAGDWNGNREAVFAHPDATVEDTVAGWRDTDYQPQAERR